MKFLDELLAFFMMCLVFLDVIINKQYKKYKLLWIVIGIMTFYAVYSLTWVSYNTPRAILQDFIVQLKPFCYFFVSYAVVPKFDYKIRFIIKKICILNVLVVLFCIVTGLVPDVLFHVLYIGLIAVVSFLAYLYSSIDRNGQISRNDIIILLLLLTIGLAGTRTKFYGEFIIALYLLFVYRPGIMKEIKMKHILSLISVVVLVLVVAWNKIDYYFISGGQDFQMFDEDMMSSFARPVLYVSMFVLLGIHPFFGSGLASFGTYASSTSVNYAGTYATLGIDKVWGLSDYYDAFICDAFYPSLAQFGVIGIIMFVAFFIWIYRRLELTLYLDGKILYTVGMVAIVVIIIENIAATTFNQGAGAMCMMILGCLVSKYKDITKEQETEMKKMPYKEKGALDYIRK